ncbi:hypothetical protein [Pontibacter harenae]|uniref:hypothetical protein n=1 Tax=Pontibacter harenae TaxID=2894083 RepID=UPI001E5F60E2|nr:hypothetical protein [Pontibacter harenae]MCC9166468.1 hypothetical protein [Pontibacter harenae]
MKQLFIIVLTTLLSLSTLLPSVAQTGGNGRRTGIVADFLRNNTPQKLNEVASNVLKVVNRTSRPISFSVGVTIPDNWQLVPRHNNSYSLSVGDSVFIPVRIIPSALSKGNMNYVVMASLIGANGAMLTSVNWYVPVQKKSQWVVQVPSKEVYFKNGENAADFSLKLSNYGNADENVRVSFTLDRRLQLLDTAGTNILPKALTVPLAVGVDTVLYFKVRKPDDSELLSRRKPNFDGLSSNIPQEEVYRVNVSAQGQAADGEAPRSWSGTVLFTKLPSVKALNDYTRSSLPLTLEINSFDFLSNATNLNVLAYGSMFIKENNLLTYRMQTNFLTNYYDGTTYLGQDHYIGYFADRGSIEIGQVSGFGRSAVYGRGAKASYNIKTSKVGVTYVRGPELFGESNNSAVEVYQRTKVKKLTFDNSVSRRWNDFDSSTSDIANTTFSYRVLPNHNVNVGGGYSTVHYATNADSVQNGYSYLVSYSGRLKKISLSVNNFFGSDSYLVGQGIHIFNTSAIYDLEHNQAITLSHQTYRRNGVERLQMPGTRTDRVEVRYNMRKLSNSYYIGPTILHQAYNGYESLSKGVRFDFNQTTVNGIMLSASLFGGYVSAYGADVPDFFTASAGLFLKYRLLFSRLYYFYGPNGLYQEMQFVQDRINPQLLNLSTSNEFWFLKNKVMLQPLANLSYENKTERLQLNLRGRLSYYTASQMELSVFGGYVASKHNGALGYDPTQSSYEQTPYFNSNINIGFGLRKHFGVPLPGAKYHSIDVVVFKDLNGNGVLDYNEDGMENVLVNLRPMQQVDSLQTFSLQGDDLMTSEKGHASYVNMPPGQYLVRVTPLVHTEGWFAGQEQLIEVEKSKTVNMPLRRGVRLSGGIVVDRDQFTNGSSLELSRIRVTAVDSLGKTYHVLTDAQGKFSMFLPIGKYKVSVNEAALGSSYEFTQGFMLLDLTRTADNYSVTFYASEKRRKLNIKKFNSNGDEIKEEQ